MVNYQQGKIYMIICNKTGIKYIGSTCKKYLSQRLCQHRCQYNRYQLGVLPSYYSSFDVLKNGDYSIELIESFACNNRDELHKREGEIMRSTQCVNRNIIGRPPEEIERSLKIYRRNYYTTNIEKVRNYSAEHAEENKVRCKQHYLKWRDYNQQCKAFRNIVFA
jgi:hypothetical protein